ncbi:STAS domain-containing protein [bacterium]|nr:STAS domain-containing protein [bacterium]
MDSAKRRLITLTRDAYVELEELRRDSEWLNAESLQEVVINFKAVTLLDSMMVGHLVKLKLALKARNIGLRLENLSPGARMVLYHSHLGDLFGIALAPPRWEQDGPG